MSKQIIRLWRLGSLQHKIVPTPRAQQKLADILNDGVTDDNVLDIIWGPDIDCQVISGDVDSVEIKDGNLKLERKLSWWKRITQHLKKMFLL